MQLCTSKLVQVLIPCARLCLQPLQRQHSDLGGHVGPGEMGEGKIKPMSPMENPLWEDRSWKTLWLPLQMAPLGTSKPIKVPVRIAKAIRSVGSLPGMGCWIWPHLAA